MSKWIIANCDLLWTRVALIEDNQVVDLYIEHGDLPEGDIYKGRVTDVLPGMDAAFVDIGLERTALIHTQDIAPHTAQGIDLPQGWKGRRPSISDLLHPGQEIIVQVMRIPFQGKGARLTTRITIPGRFLVLVPGADYVGVSHRIKDREETKRLRQLAESIRPGNCGLIVRTEAEGRGEEEIKHDLENLLSIWENIQRKAREVEAPAVLYREPGLLGRVVRDEFGSDVEKFIIDSREGYQRVVEMLEDIDPGLISRVRLYEGPVPIFDYYGVEEEIRKALKPRVYLKCGGHITFYETGALTVVDVNTGRFVGATRLSDTILQTNLEAAEEIARQLRLRDIGGIILIDFIDMPRMRDRAKVMEVLERALKKDRARIKIIHISPLGLVELTRKRRSPGLSGIMQNECPRCEGKGRVPSPVAVASEIARQLRLKAHESKAPAFLVAAHPDVAVLLVGERGRVVAELEKQTGRAIYVRVRDDLLPEQFVIEEGNVEEIERRAAPLEEDEVVEVSGKEVLTSPSGEMLAKVRGCLVDLVGGDGAQAEKLLIRIRRSGRSFAEGEVVKRIGGS